jgi:hypothetical protein
LGTNILASSATSGIMITAISASSTSRDSSKPESLQDIGASHDGCGDFVDSDEECEVEEVTEAVERYCQGLSPSLAPVDA